METREWKFTDKSKWRRGEWDDEPDKVQWQDEATGLPCLIVRGPAGALCGYVGLAEDHPYFGIGYSGCAKKPACEDADCWEHSPGHFLEVHGGLTFSDFCAEDREHGICHLPAPGEPEKVWWLGFDCAHSGDLSPKYNHLSSLGEYESYKNIQYVKNECASLARQLRP